MPRDGGSVLLQEIGTQIYCLNAVEDGVNAVVPLTGKRAFGQHRAGPSSGTGVQNVGVLLQF